MDYNFVSIEEFFSLEESGALLESGKFKGRSIAVNTCDPSTLPGEKVMFKIRLLHFLQ